MSSSSAFIDLLEQLDMWWPEGNGNSLRIAADSWNQTADVIDEITAVLHSVAERLTDNYRGEAADRFTQTWSAWTGDTGYLGVTAADCRRLGAALQDFATDVDVADRTLVQFIEQALSESAIRPNPANPAMLPQDWLNWLQTAGAQLCSHLTTQTSAHTTDLGVNVGTCALPPAPGDVTDLSSLISTNVSWPNPGTPADLTSLANGEVNFGAGQGSFRYLPPSITPLPLPPTVHPVRPPGDRVFVHHQVVPPPPASSVDSPTTGPATDPTSIPGGEVSSVTPQAPIQGSTQAVNPTAAPQIIDFVPLLMPPIVPAGEQQFVSAQTISTSGQASQIMAPLATGGSTPPTSGAVAAGTVPPVPSDLTAPLTDETFDRLVDELLGVEGAAVASKAVKVASQSPLPGVISARKIAPQGPNSFASPLPAPLRPLNMSDIRDGVANVADKTTSTLSAAGTAAVSTTSEDAASISAAITKSMLPLGKAEKTKSQFPMMPMGGGSMSSGDDANEPKRRNLKRAVIPPPIVQ